ncbi:MAG: DoxX family protein [Actinomycetota bacterium]|nr:DoxX family protein [Actinomycetota bacterium]
MLIRRLARPLLAGVFVTGGLDALRQPAAKAKVAADPIDEAAHKMDVDAPETETLVKVNAGAMIGAGVLLSTGKLPRLSSVVLAGTLVPTTWAGHRFWEEEDPERKAQQQIHFMKNLGLLGGLILAAVDTEGKPGLAWRAKHAGQRLADAAPSLPGKD